MLEKRFFYTAGNQIETKKHTVQIVTIEKGTLRAAIKGEQAVITIPHDMDEKSDHVQEFIKKVITEICRKEAKEYLPERVKALAGQFGFTYQKVFIKNLKSKWGSCSSMGNINLNLSLMLLPDHLIDYIILHELAHIREHNHGENFWKLLNKLTNGNARAYDKEIKKNYRII